MERKTGRSAPYGQSCLSCFKTKCKCVPRLEGNGCERCHRLNRPCHSADALRRRGDRKRNLSSDARIAKLEDTLGQLFSLLQTGSFQAAEISRLVTTMPNLNPSVFPYPGAPPEGTNVSSTLEDARSQATNPIVLVDDNNGNTITSTSSGASLRWNGYGANDAPPVGSPLSTVSGASGPTGVSMPAYSDPACLDIFRSRMLRHFPFVYIPDHVTAQQLQRDRPFLFRAIDCVTSSSMDDKRTKAFELKRILCEAVLLQQSPQSPFQTLDLLLGLLTYIAWGWDNLLSHNLVCRLMALAMSLVGEVRTLLSHDEPKLLRTIHLLEPNGMATSMEISDAQLRLEYHRAVLGYFVLGSAVSAYFYQVDAPRWMPQMDESLASVTAASTNGNGNTEYPYDAALALQARIQLFTMRARQVRERCQLPGESPPVILPPPALLHIKTLVGQLQDLRASVLPALQQNSFILSQTYYAELCIIESIHLQDYTDTTATSPTPQELRAQSICGPSRSSCFLQSTLAIKSCLSTFLTFSPSDFLGLCFVQWVQFTRSIATLHHLITLNEPDWDLSVVRSLVGLPVLLTCASEKLELAAAEAGEQPEGAFTQLARGLRMFQAAYYHENGMLRQLKEPRAAGAAEGEVGADMLTYGQQSLMTNPTLWLDQFFVEYEEREMPL